MDALPPEEHAPGDPLLAPGARAAEAAPSAASAAGTANRAAKLREKNPLPEGTLSVGAGLLISGLAAYGFLAIARRVLGAEEFAPLSLLWVLTFIAAPGFFLPVEQEVGRALAHRRAVGQGGYPVARRAAVLGGVILAALWVVILVLSPRIVEHTFHGSWGLLVGLLLAIAGYAIAHLTRGMFSGTGRFSRYGLVMGADGLIRVVGCALVAALGVTSLGWYGLLVGIPPFLAVAIAARHQRGMLTPGPPAPWNELTVNLGWLLAGSVLAALLVNVGPLAVNLLAPDTPEAKTVVGAFAAAVLIARVPLFLFQAVQAALLPKLARLSAQGLHLDFTRALRKLLAAVLVVGVVGVVGAFLLGPWALSKFFGYDLGRRTLTLLALASAIYMLAVATAQALIALHGHAKVAVGWALGMGAFVVVTALGNDLLLRVEAGLIAGSVIAALFFGVSLLLALHRGIEPSPDAVFDAVLESPSIVEA